MHAHPRRRAYETGSGRIPLILSQHGVQLRVLLAMLAMLPAALLLTDDSAVLSRALQGQGAIGTGVAAVMAGAGLLLIIDWLLNDERERLAGRPTVDCARRCRDIPEFLVVGGWVMTGLACVTPTEFAGHWWRHIPTGGAAVWAAASIVIAFFGTVSAIEGAWRRGANQA